MNDENFFAVIEPDGTLRRLRPEWVTIVNDGTPVADGGTIVGYLYYPDGRDSGQAPVPMQTSEVLRRPPSKAIAPVR